MNKVILVTIKIACIIMLVVAVAPLPYDFYTVLRWVVCGVSIYFAYTYSTNENRSWVWIFGVIAIFFNPIFPVHLSKGTWRIFDIAAAIVFFGSLWTKRKA